MVYTYIHDVDYVLDIVYEASCHTPSHSQSHLNENTEEVEMATKLFPGQDSTAKIFDYHGLLTDKVSILH